MYLYELVPVKVLSVFQFIFIGICIKLLVLLMYDSLPLELYMCEVIMKCHQHFQIYNWKQWNMGSVSHQGAHRVPSWACGNHCWPLWRPKCHCQGMEGESCWIWLCFQWEPSHLVLGKSRHSSNVRFGWVWRKWLSFQISVPRFHAIKEDHGRSLILFSIMNVFIIPLAFHIPSLLCSKTVVVHFL